MENVSTHKFIFVQNGGIHKLTVNLWMPPFRTRKKQEGSIQELLPPQPTLETNEHDYEIIEFGSCLSLYPMPIKQI